jgi:hypothetical protein
MPKGVYDRKCLEARILERVSKNDETGCWIWTGYLDADGYGQISDKCKTVRVHKIMYEIKNGPIPIGLLAGHLCDDKYPIDSIENRKCCNPNHISPMTNKENIQRALTLKRLKKPTVPFTTARTSGENNVKAKLTAEIVLEIRTKLKDTQKYGDLKLMADEYGIQYQTLYKISKGTLWNKPEYYP